MQSLYFEPFGLVTFDAAGGAPQPFTAPQQAGKNVYFHVNTGRLGQTGRLSNDRTELLRAFHVDIDPPAHRPPGLWVADWHANLAKRLTEDGATSVWVSGRGVQAIWVLTTPQILGSPEARTLAGSYNGALAKRYGGDGGATDVARVLKLPGSAAYPSPQKIAAGWKVTVACMIGGTGKQFDNQDIVSLVKDYIEAPQTSRARAPKCRFAHAFAQRHSVSEFLEAAGFTTANGKGWHHQAQTTASFGTDIDADDQGFVTASGTVAQLLGGAHCGDAMDMASIAFGSVAVQEQARKYWNVDVTAWWNSTPARTVGGEPIERNMQEDRQAYKIALDAYIAELGTKGTKFTTLGPLYGFAARVADHVEKHVMYYDQPDIAKITAVLALSTFAGRKDSFEGAAPVFNCIGLGITGIGKNVVSTFLQRLFHELALRYPSDFSHNELNVFQTTTISEGVKAYNTQMSRRLSTITISTEAGLAKESKAGDRRKVTAYMMSNTAQGAYVPLQFSEQAQGLLPVYGVVNSTYEESTIETYRQHMTAEDFESGRSGRHFLFRFDVARGNNRQQRASYTDLPPWLLEGFRLLALEALRGEDQAMGTLVNEVPSPSTIPVPTANRYSATQEVIARLEELYQHTRLARQRNVANTADMKWSQNSGRSTLLLMQVCQIFARTEHIVNGFPAIIDLQAFGTAEMLALASQATEQGNMDSFVDPLDAVCITICEYAAAALKKPPKTTLQRAFGARADMAAMMKDNTLPWAFFTNGAINAAVTGMATPTHNKAQVWNDVRNHGQMLEFWQFTAIKNKTFLKFDFTRLFHQ